MSRHLRVGISVSACLFPLAVFIFLCFPSPAHSEANLHAGALQFHPYLVMREVVSDNVYSTATARKHDRITTAIPGLKLVLPLGNHKIETDYNAVLNRYSQYVEENTSDHNAGVDGELHLASRFTLKLNDKYKKGHEPRGQSATGFIEKFWTNDATASLQYALTDISKVRYDFSVDKWDFHSSKFRNRHDYDNSLYLYYRILPKTSIFAEYDHNRSAFEIKNPDLSSRTDGGQFGLTWDISERSKGTVKAGYQRKNFNEKSLKDYGSWIYSVDVKHDFPSRTSLALLGQRTVNEANLQGTSYFQTTGGRVELSQRMYEKFLASVNGVYGVDKFSNAVLSISTLVRRDVTVSGGATVKYMMRDWLDFSLGYTHRERNSNIDSNDYDRNEYMFQISAAM